MSEPIGTVIVPAHNEEAVIARSLAQLARLAESGEVVVVVACNGCTDGTVAVASAFPGVIVLDIPTASKVAGMRGGDEVAVPGRPRIYLDADVVMTADAVRAVLGALSGDAPRAARPPVRFDASGASWAVRRWYVVRQALPSIQRVLWGSGTYGLSASGRERFGEWPDIVSDDLFIDDLFADDERMIVATDPVAVTTPRRGRDLVRILRRTYRTQREVLDAEGAVVSSGQRGQLADLAAIVRDNPLRLVDCAVYAGLILSARLEARIRRRPAWERDDSSRQSA
jgi:hypothetical protein